jgi:hypothetical protein
LKGILGVLDLSENPPAHARNQWPMPANQSREGSLIAVLAEQFQQLSVGQLSGRSRLRCPAEVTKRRRQVSPGHGSSLHPKEAYH